MDKFSTTQFSQDLAKVSDEKKAAEMVHKKAVEARNVLHKEWRKGSKNMIVLGQTLEHSKWLLSRMNFMPGGKASEKDEILIAREILEIGARYSVAIADMKGFDSYMDLLKGYYFDMRKCFKEDSTSMYELLGLNLLRLLTENRISEFHLELELFVHQDVKKVLENEYIARVVKIEQNMTEGRFNQIYKELELAPTPDYKYFIGILLETIKGGIATSIERAYEHLQVKDAASLLNITEKEMIEFAAKRKWNYDDNGRFCFDCVKNPYLIDEKEKLTWLEKSLTYAKELEKIV